MQTRVKEEVRKYIVQNLLSGDARDFTDETDLQETAILDSFATLELVEFLESTFGVTLGAGQIQPGTFRSVDSIARTIDQALAGPTR
jgi:acyl carrier protein